MLEVFPPIHLYALLAAAVALMTGSISRELYGLDQGWLKRWTPFILVVLTVGHISIVILQQLLKCFDWHLISHGAILVVVVAIGGAIYTDHLSKITVDRNATLPPLEPEADGS